MHTRSGPKIYNEYFTGGRVRSDTLFNNLSVNTTKDEKSYFKKFSFKYLNYVVLWMNFFENGIHEQNDNYLLFKATNLRSTTSFPQNQIFFSWSFSDQKKHARDSCIEIYVKLFSSIFSRQLIWQKMDVWLLYSTRNRRSSHSLDRQE